MEMEIMLQKDFFRVPPHFSLLLSFPLSSSLLSLRSLRITRGIFFCDMYRNDAAVTVGKRTVKTLRVSTVYLSENMQ